MLNTQSPFRQQVYELANRTKAFARNVRHFAVLLPKKFETVEDIKQLIRSSGSIGANYLEADEAMSKKDFIKCLKICRKEARESIYRLEQLQALVPSKYHTRCVALSSEARELLLIFNASIRKAQINVQKASKK